MDNEYDLVEEQIEFERIIRSAVLKAIFNNEKINYEYVYITDHSHIVIHKKTEQNSIFIPTTLLRSDLIPDKKEFIYNYIIGAEINENLMSMPKVPLGDKTSYKAKYGVVMPIGNDPREVIETWEEKASFLNTKLKKLTDEEIEKLKEASKFIKIKRGTGGSSFAQEIDIEFEIDDEKEYMQTWQDDFLLKDIKKSNFHGSKIELDFTEKTFINRSALEIENILEKRNIELSSLSVKKKLNQKTISTDNDKIYLKNEEIGNGILNINFFVDMSGSMHGIFIKNALMTIDIFSKVARNGLIEGNVYFATDNYRFEAPIEKFNENNIYYMSNCLGCDEMIARNLLKHEQEVIKADLNVCLTDGQLVGKRVDKEYWENKANIIGIYSVENSREKDLEMYEKNLKRWFDKPIVERIFKDCISTILIRGLRAKDV